jgi:hypothetical protein
MATSEASDQDVLFALSDYFVGEKLFLQGIHCLEAALGMQPTDARLTTFPCTCRADHRMLVIVTGIASPPRTEGKIRIRLAELYYRHTQSIDLSRDHLERTV